MFDQRTAERSFKQECLAIDPTLVCKRVQGQAATGTTVIAGYFVYRGGNIIAMEACAWDAWRSALCALEYELEKGRYAQLVEDLEEWRIQQKKNLV